MTEAVDSNVNFCRRKIKHEEKKREGKAGQRRDLMMFGSGGRQRPVVLQPGLSAGPGSSHNILLHLVLEHPLTADTGALLFGIGLCSGEVLLSNHFFGVVRSRGACAT
jgi:hypothetical protein